MATVQQIIDARAPHYTSDPRLSVMETLAAAETGVCFGTLRNNAIALLMLHWMSMDDRDSANQAVGGTVKREKEGMLEREYMIDFSLTRKYPDLSQTRWGLELIRLRKSTLMGPRNRFTNPCTGT